MSGLAEENKQNEGFYLLFSSSTSPTISSSTLRNTQLTQKNDQHLSFPSVNFYRHKFQQTKSLCFPDKES